MILPLYLGLFWPIWAILLRSYALFGVNNAECKIGQAIWEKNAKWDVPWWILVFVGKKLGHLGLMSKLNLMIFY